MFVGNIALFAVLTFKYDNLDGCLAGNQCISSRLLWAWCLAGGVHFRLTPKGLWAGENIRTINGIL